MFVALAAIAWSSAGVLQRGLEGNTATQVGGRAVFAALALLLWVAITERGGVVRATRAVGGAGVAFAVSLAVASGCFIAALNHTRSLTSSSSRRSRRCSRRCWRAVALREPVSLRTALAMAVALAGVALMIGGPGEGDVTGDVLALVMAFGFAVSIVISRHRRDVSMAPATCLSQMLLVVAFLPFADPGPCPATTCSPSALLGAGQIGLGLGLMTVGARLIPAAEIALISLLEVVLGPIWVWFAFTELPGTATLAAARWCRRGAVQAGGERGGRAGARRGRATAMS